MLHRQSFSLNTGTPSGENRIEIDKWLCKFASQSKETKFQFCRYTVGTQGCQSSLAVQIDTLDMPQGQMWFPPPSVEQLPDPESPSSLVHQCFGGTTFGHQKATETHPKAAKKRIRGHFRWNFIWDCDDLKPGQQAWFNTSKVHPPPAYLFAYWLYFVKYFLSWYSLPSCIDVSSGLGCFVRGSLFHCDHDHWNWETSGRTFIWGLGS